MKAVKIGLEEDGFHLEVVGHRGQGKGEVVSEQEDLLVTERSKADVVGAGQGGDAASTPVNPKMVVQGSGGTSSDAGVHLGTAVRVDDVVEKASHHPPVEDTEDPEYEEPDSVTSARIRKIVDRLDGGDNDDRGDDDELEEAAGWDYQGAPDVGSR